MHDMVRARPRRVVARPCCCTAYGSPRGESARPAGLRHSQCRAQRPHGGPAGSGRAARATGCMCLNNAMDTEEARAIAQAFDPSRLNASFYANPYDVYAALRAFEPVHRCPDGSYFLSRFADLDEIYRDRTHFSSDKKAVFGPKFGPDSPLYEHHTTSLVFNYPPYRTRVRRQIVGALSPNALRALEPGVTALVDRLLEQLQERQ